MHVDICIQDNKHVWNQTTIIGICQAAIELFWLHTEPDFFPQVYFHNIFLIIELKYIEDGHFQRGRWG